MQGGRIGGARYRLIGGWKQVDLASDLDHAHSLASAFFKPSQCSVAIVDKPIEGSKIEERLS